MSYHNGSVWPHDNALIGMGLRRATAMRDEAARILDGLFGACIYIDLRRLPELFCGFPRRRGQGPTFYPVACAPQAWAAATPLACCSPASASASTRRARDGVLRPAVLPHLLDEVVLRGLVDRRQPHRRGSAPDRGRRRGDDACCAARATSARR